jgi:transcriptional regulator with XRE-family HTH domain
MRSLKKIREAKGHTQEQMAQRFGVSVMTWRRYEQGKTEPTWEKAEAIADYLGVTLDEIAGRAQAAC